jgi:APA family basic amino acid/polyamine antiporter
VTREQRPPPFVEALRPDGEPARVLGPVDATCVVIGAVIGVGIFFTPTEVARTAGSAPLAMLAWGLGGLISLCGALTFAELGARFNAAGAQYEALRTAWGSFIGFLFVFCIATVIVPGATAIIAIVCAQYLCAAVGVDVRAIDLSALERAAASIGWEVQAGAFQGVPLLAISTALVLGLMGANLIGARWGAAIQNLTVYAKVAALIMIAAAAALWAGAAGATDLAPASGTTGQSGSAGLAPVAGVLAALVPAFFSYGGWQQALWISGEVRDPARTLPRAIIIGTILVIVVYMLANWAYFRLLGESGVMSTRTLASDAVRTVAPLWGERLVAAAVAISSFGILNVEFLSGPRLTYAMSRDGYFFPLFGRLSRSGTPGPAIALLAVATLMLLFVAGEDGISRLLNGVTFVDGVFFVLTGAAVIALRRRPAPPGRSTGARTFRVPLYPWVPLLFILGEIGVVVGAFLNPEVRQASIIGALWIAIGAVIYLALGSRRAAA